MAGSRGLYRVEVDNRQLRVLLNTARLELSPEQMTFMGGAMRNLATRVQARAVRNVSGYPVHYDGRIFRVVVRTGTLKGAIESEWPYQSALQARVYVNGAHTAVPFQQGDRTVKPRPVAAYAAAIEYGHGEIDLKKTMMGKTVPFFASRTSNSTGPFSVRGLTPVDGSDGALWENKRLNARLAHPLWHGGRKGPMQFQRRVAAAYAGGKQGGGTYYIAFRKVGKHGWIIPAARERPFMRAAARQSQADARRLTGEQLTELLRNDARTANH